MIQAQWPVLDLPVFLSMLINFGLGLLGGLVGGWISHLLATRRDRQGRKWQEFIRWHNVLEQADKEVSEMARPGLRVQYIYGEEVIDISHFAPLEQRIMERARDARLRVEALAKELGVDPGLPSSTLAKNKAVTGFIVDKASPKRRGPFS